MYKNHPVKIKQINHIRCNIYQRGEVCPIFKAAGTTSDMNKKKRGGGVIPVQLKMLQTTLNEL